MRRLLSAALALCMAQFHAPLPAHAAEQYTLTDFTQEITLTPGAAQEICLDAAGSFMITDSAHNIWVADTADCTAPFTDIMLHPESDDGAHYMFSISEPGSRTLTLTEKDGALLLSISAHTHSPDLHVTDNPCARTAFDQCLCGAVYNEGALTDQGDSTLFAHDFTDYVRQPLPCTAPGILHRVCRSCGYECDTDLPVQGHKLSEAADGTDGAVPQQHWLCTVCGGYFADAKAETPISVPRSGSYDNITWSLTDGLLTVSGEGKLGWDPASPPCPWQKYREEVTALEVGEGITALDSYVFAFLTSLETVELPETLTAVGAHCFEADIALTTVTLPDAVSTLGSYTFYMCGALNTISAPGVTAVADHCFQDCAALESVALGNALQTVAQDAFSGCTRLFSDGACKTVGSVLVQYAGNSIVLQIPDGTRLIAQKAFSGASKLVSAVCPDSLRIIDDCAFSGCKKLSELRLNDGLERIGENAFSDCALTTITIPASVTEIGEQSGCALTEVCGVPGTAAEAFAKENGIPFRAVTDTLPDMTIDYSSDGWYFGNSGAVFGSTYRLTDRDRVLVDLLKPVSTDELNGSWGGSCFGLCLTVLLAKTGHLPPEKLQEGAQTLHEVEPTDRIVSMINYYHAVQFSAEYLRTQPSAVRGETAAQMMGRLIRSAELVKAGGTPLLIDMTTQTGRHCVLAYGTEPADRTVSGRHYDGRILVWDSNFPAALNDDVCIYYNSETLDYCLPYYGIGGGVGGINTVTNDLGVLNALPYLDAVKVPGDVNCDDTVNIADAVLLARFLSEDSAVQVTAQGKVNAELDGVEGLTPDDSVILLENLAGLRQYRESLQYFSFTENADGWTVSGIDPELKTVDIPAEYDNKPVTAVDLSCEENTKWECIRIPASVTQIIAHSALHSFLTAFEVSEGNPAFQSIDGVLFDRTGKTLIRYPNGRTDDQYYMPDGVEAIGDEAFYGNVKLREIHFKEGLLKIGRLALARCGLKQINFPESLETIGEYALSDNVSLRTLMIPANVTSAERVFKGCKRLNEVGFVREEPCYETIFDEFTGQITVYAPEGCEERYTAHFAKAIEAGIVTVYIRDDIIPEDPEEYE